MKAKGRSLSTGLPVALAWLMIASGAALAQDGSNETEGSGSGRGSSVEQARSVDMPRISNVFVDTELRQALADISAATGIPIMVGDRVEGTISVELKDKPLPEALDMLLASGGYVWRRMDGYILVGSPSPDSDLFLRLSETRRIDLKHITTAEAINMLAPPLREYVTTGAETRGEPQDGTAAGRAGATAQDAAQAAAAGQTAGTGVDGDFPAQAGPTAPGAGAGQRGSPRRQTERGRLVVTAPPSILERIVEDVKSLDQASRHVLLEGRVVVLERNDVLDLGIDWDFPTVNVGTFNPDATEQSFPLTVSATSQQGVQFTEGLMLALNFLQENEEATVVSNPQVTVRDGELAQMNVITEEYFQIETEDTADLQVVDAGTRFSITPLVGSDDDITLQISVELSEVVARGADNLPVVTRRTTSGNIELKNGGTAAIGGLMETRIDAINNKVPGVGDVPLLGKLFQKDNVTEEDKQVAVFITATIVEEPPIEPRAHAPKPTVDEAAFRTELEQALGQLDLPKETADAP